MIDGIAVVPPDEAEHIAAETRKLLERGLREQGCEFIPAASRTRR